MSSIAIHTKGRQSGPRLLNFSRDIKQVASLIEQAFGPELDAAGWAALREMRLAARLSPILSWLTPAEYQNSRLKGLVWVEQGKIVGNVNFQALQQHPSRYLIANVAVAPDYRGQGIARELMHLALEHIAEMGGRWAILQVNAHNEIALGMYQRLGFQEILEEQRLRIEELSSIPDIPLPPGAELRPLRDGSWQDVRALARHAIPNNARWWHPTRSASFRSASSPLLQRKLSRWLEIEHKLRWGLFIEGNLMGVVDMDVLLYDEHRIDILLMPELRELWTAPLLARALRYLQRQPARPVSAVLYDYQPQAISILQDFGFQPTLTLMNMRKRIHTSY